MATTPIASDLSYLVLQKRRESGELSACALDSTNQALYPLPSQHVLREAFIADRPAITDSFQGELVEIPVWLFHRRKR